MQCLDHFGQTKMTSPAVAVSRNQRGYVMILSMLMLLIITVISISMAKSFFLEEGMAGNLREKTRALGAAQTALTYGEWYVANHQGYGVNCTTAGQLANPTICTQAVNISSQNSTSGTNLTVGNSNPFNIYFTYTPENTAYLNVASPGVDTFYAPPGLYIQFVGLDTSNSDYIYKITAYGYGGSPTSVAVVQSTFMTVAAVKNLGGA